MKVIGAGLPRTATLTQKIALETLGFPCYHMVNVLGDLDLAPLWKDAYDGNGDWDQIFDGFEATVDWPGGFFYSELAERYPDAKVLLSVRDPESWERSMRKTVWACYYGDSLTYHLCAAIRHVNPKWDFYIRMMTDLLWEDRGTLKGNHHDKDGLIEGFHRHTEAVKEAIPAERLLIWQASDGWGPLCEFLEVEVPDQPLPQVNDGEMFGDRIVDMAMGNLSNYRKARQDAQTANEPAVAN
jgi:Sulfotransferase domain